MKVLRTMLKETSPRVLSLVGCHIWREREREMDQMKRAMEEMKYSMKRVNHVDDLIHKIDSPFTASVTSHPLPSKFKMPTLDSYDRTHNPCDHIATFKMTMHL